MEQNIANKPTAVSSGTKQEGEIHDRWPWVEAVVWTERMLTALETGVKGGKWHSLIDKVYALPTLRAAFARVKANHGAAGVDHQTIAMYEQNLAKNLRNLSEELRQERYKPSAIRRKWIPKPGTTEKRPLGIPTIRDRVVQTALRMVLEPIYEQTFAAQSYGFRPRRGAKDALRRVNELLEKGYIHVVDVDLKSYFDTIPHAALQGLMAAQVADGRVLRLIGQFLTQGILGELGEVEEVYRGTPQGAVVSPLLSNIYLNPLDQLMAARGREMVRYADDFVLLCRSREEAEAALEEIRQWTQEAGLQLHPVKTKVVDAITEGFEFLGYEFKGGKRRPRKKSLRKFKDTIRRLTRRTNGESLTEIIKRVNASVEGWFGYFQHSHHWTFGPLDRWIRMRLRSILRKRAGRRGRGRGDDHHRWPNAFFAAAGLINLEKAQLQKRQSLTG